MLMRNERIDIHREAISSVPRYVWNPLLRDHIFRDILDLAHALG